MREHDMELRNTSLIFQFWRDTIPDRTIAQQAEGKEIILLPQNDPFLSGFNQEMAKTSALEGADVFIKPVAGIKPLIELPAKV